MLGLLGPWVPGPLNPEHLFLSPWALILVLGLVNPNPYPLGPLGPLCAWAPVLDPLGPWALDLGATQANKQSEARQLRVSIIAVDLQ